MLIMRRKLVFFSWFRLNPLKLINSSKQYRAYYQQWRVTLQCQYVWLGAR